MQRSNVYYCQCVNVINLDVKKVAVRSSNDYHHLDDTRNEINLDATTLTTKMISTRSVRKKGNDTINFLKWRTNWVFPIKMRRFFCRSVRISSASIFDLYPNESNRQHDWHHLQYVVKWLCILKQSTDMGQTKWWGERMGQRDSDSDTDGHSIHNQTNCINFTFRNRICIDFNGNKECYFYVLQF